MTNIVVLSVTKREVLWFSLAILKIYISCFAIKALLVVVVPQLLVLSSITGGAPVTSP